MTEDSRHGRLAAAVEFAIHREHPRAERRGFAIGEALASFRSMPLLSPFTMAAITSHR